MQPILQDVLGRRRNRAIATLLSFKERECDQYLPEALQKRLRTEILDQLNDFHDLALDVMKSLDDGSYTVNELWVEAIETIQRDVREVREVLNATVRT